MSMVVQSFIADFLQMRKVANNGKFAVDAAHAIDSVPQWTAENLITKLKTVRTDLFRGNRHVRKPDLLVELAGRLMKEASTLRRPT